MRIKRERKKVSMYHGQHKKHFTLYNNVYGLMSCVPSPINVFFLSLFPSELCFLIAFPGCGSWPGQTCLFGSTSKNSKIGKNFLQSPIFVNVYGAQE
jgi:hypothetical protein